MKIKKTVVYYSMSNVASLFSILKPTCLAKFPVPIVQKHYNIVGYLAG